MSITTFDVVTLSLLLCATLAWADPALRTWPAPEGERRSNDYRVRVEGRDVFVHVANVRYKILKGQGNLWTHAPDAPHEHASLAMFDFAEPVTVEVEPMRDFERVAVLPRSAGVEPTIEDGTIRLRLERPRHLTLMLDDDDSRLLHLLCSPPERNVPSPDDPDVVYFGPGVHEITEPIKLESGQTLYLTGGAVLRVKLRPGEEGKMHPKFNLRHYPGQVIVAHRVEDVTIRGRGIIDASRIPHPGRNMIAIRESENVRVEGILLRDASTWNVHINRSTDVEVDNLRILAGRLNSDGINSVSSQNIHIHDCFIRNRDDSIPVKSKPGRPSENIRVARCTIWNDWGYALGVTYETQSDIRNVIFRDCDVLQAHIAAMGVYATDNGTVEHIRFEDIRVGDLSPTRRFYGRLPKLIRVALAKDMWATDEAFGRIENIRFSNIAAQGPLPASEIHGQPGHPIRDVRIENITHQGQPLTTLEAANIQANAHTEQIRLQPPR